MQTVSVCCLFQYGPSMEQVRPPLSEWLQLVKYDVSGYKRENLLTGTCYLVSAERTRAALSSTVGSFLPCKLLDGASAVLQQLSMCLFTNKDIITLFVLSSVYCLKLSSFRNAKYFLYLSHHMFRLYFSLLTKNQLRLWVWFECQKNR